MIQKLITSVCLLVLLMITSTQAGAVVSNDTVLVSIPKFDITVNNQKIDNAYEKYPLIVYKDITYFPMTWNYANALGLQVSWDSMKGFSISKATATATDVIADKGERNTSTTGYVAKLPSFQIFVNNTKLDNAKEAFPLLTFRDITYFPMTWKFAAETFGLDASFDAIKGFRLGVKSQVSTPTTKAVLTGEEIYQTNNPSIVFIETFSADRKTTGYGSGVIVRTDGTIVTNYHVISNESNPVSAVVTLANGQKHDVARIIDYNKMQDIAVLKVDNVKGLTATTAGSSENIKVGQSIYTIGYPLGVGSTMSTGIISSSSTILNLTQYIQITAPISPGSSGGALFNIHGELIGITAASLVDGQNMNLAVPIHNFLKMSLDKNASFSQLHSTVGNQQIIASEETPTTYEQETNGNPKEANPVNSKEFYLKGTTNLHDDLDFFTVSVESFSKVVLLGLYQDAALTPDLSITIIDAFGSTVGFSNKMTNGKDGQAYQDIMTILRPGTYFIKISQKGGPNNQTLYNEPQAYTIYGIMQ